MADSPLDFFSRLRDEESDGVCRKLGSARVDGDLVVGALVRLHLDGQQQQLQLDEAESGTGRVQFLRGGCWQRIERSAKRRDLSNASFQKVKQLKVPGGITRSSM